MYQISRKIQIILHFHIFKDYFACVLYDMSLEHDLYVNKSPIPLSNYAKKLEPKVKKRYEEKISDIGVDPMLIEGKYFQPDCSSRINRFTVLPGVRNKLLHKAAV